MNDERRRPHAADQASATAGTATAEGGFVILDGLPGLAATLTPDAAMLTGQLLIEAAKQARLQH